MTNEEKLDAVRQYLDENKIPYTTPKDKENHLCDLFMTDKNVAIHISNDRDEEFFQKYRKMRPVFIRDDETIEYIMFKIDNTIKTHHIHDPRRRLAKYQKQAKKEGLSLDEYNVLRKKRREEIYENTRKKNERRKRQAERDERRKRKAEMAALKKKPKRKRKRIVRYEKV